MNYCQRVANALRPLGVEQHELAAMILEWRYTDTCHDKEQAIHTCELCSKSNLRYQFEIKNRHTDNTLLIGSECILNFLELLAGKSGKTIDRKAAQARLRLDRRQGRKIAANQRIYDLLHGIALADLSVDAESLYAEYRERGAFSPQRLLEVTNCCTTHPGQVVNASDLKMIIRRNSEKDELREMSHAQAEIVWNSMSDSQRKWYKERNGDPIATQNPVDLTGDYSSNSAA